MRHVLFFFFVLLALGVALGRAELFASINAWVPGVLAAFCMVTAWFVSGRGRAFAVWTVAATLSLGCFLSLASPNRIQQQKWSAEIAQTEGRAVVIEGVMTEGRRAWRDAYGRDRYSFTLTVPGGAGVRVSGVSGSAGAADAGTGELPEYGQSVRATGTIMVPGGRTNPAGFDWRSFLTTRGTYAVLRAQTFEVIGTARGWRGAVYSLRERLVRRMDAALGPEAADISKAIFLGERSELEPDFRRALVNTGTLHLFAISGFNVGFVALVLFALFAVARVPDPFKSLTVLALLIGYAILVGDNSPVVRAVIMAGFLILAGLLRTRITALQGLGAAGILMTAMNPEEVFDPAFQLSFAAVAGLAVIVPLWGSLADVRRARSDRRSAQGRAWLTLTVLTSLAAWIATAPILIHHFNRFSVVAPAVNVLLVPIAFLLNLLLMIFAALACAVPAAAQLLAVPIEAHTRALVFLVDLFDRLPGASWNLASWHVTAWVLFAGWWSFLMWRRRDVRRSLRVLLSVAVLFSVITLDAVRAHAAAPRLRVTWFDVGQGNAALVELGATRVLVDAGRGGDADAAGRVLIPYLASIGASRLDAVLITHPQFDHAGGLEGLLRDIRIGGIWTNGDRADAAFYRRALRLARARGTPVRVLERGDHLDGLPQNAGLTILHPGPHARSNDLNERSLVLLLEAAGKKLLWTGDIGEEGLAELLTGDVGRVDALQVPHHGSKTGLNGGEFLDRVRPVAAVISCGRNNGYGHPHPSTLEALSQSTRRIHRTDLQGALQWTVDRHGRVSSGEGGVV